MFAELSKLLNTPDTQPASIAKPPTVSMAARYWSEGDLVSFNNRHFRIASRIGSGSFGSTFKVIEVHEGQDVGIYAGKVMFEGESGRRALNAYRRACSHTDKPHLATVFQLANEWEDDCFIALLQWVEGRTLHDWIGYTALYAEELGETPTAVVGRWITSCCEGLSSLHRAGLVHGGTRAMKYEHCLPKDLTPQLESTCLATYYLIDMLIQSYYYEMFVETASCCLSD